MKCATVKSQEVETRNMTEKSTLPVLKRKSGYLDIYGEISLRRKRIIFEKYMTGTGCYANSMSLSSSIRIPLMGLFLVGLLTTCSTGKAEVSPELAIRAIVGEAENQGLIGMQAVAEAIRNRGHLKGVYGLKRNISRTPSNICSLARTAWSLSEKSNLVKGATGWGTDSDIEKFKREGWWNRVIVTTKIGAHTFYVERK